MKPLLKHLPKMAASGAVVAASTGLFVCWSMFRTPTLPDVKATEPSHAELQREYDHLDLKPIRPAVEGKQGAAPTLDELLNQSQRAPTLDELIKQGKRHRPNE